MCRLAGFALLAAGVSCASGSQSAELTPAAMVPDSVWILVNQPVFVAFFPPVTEAQTDSDSDLNTVLDDFGWHISHATDSLKAEGFRVEIRFADTLWLREGRRKWRFVPRPDSTPGYYLTAPRRAPVILYGVRTDDDLVEAAIRFRKGEPP